jgi:hypothetical protein
LDPARDCVGKLDVETATCPSVDPGGILTLDEYGKWLHFDAWNDNSHGMRNEERFWLR